MRPSPGLLSFARPGITLALDFPNKEEKTLRLFDALDDIVGAAGGRIYPAKDARMPAHLFQSGYPQWAQLLPYRDPGISSAMSRVFFTAASINESPGLASTRCSAPLCSM